MPSMTSPPADVSCTVRSRSGPRRGERDRRGLGRRWVAGRVALSRMVLGGRTAGSATAAAPTPAPTWFGLFAVRHPSDSSWHGSVFRTYSPLARRAPCARSSVRPARGRCGRERPTRLIERARRRCRTADRAAVALNRHAAVLRELGSVFAAAGHELYLVGGSVRDALLGRLSSDLDFTTDARPEQVQKIVRPWADALWDTGIEFGTVGVGKGDHRLEITTFRADTYDQVSRNPEVRFGDRLEDDLVRRDFTVNAMAVRITPTGPGEFLDPLGGLAALRARVLDTPAAPEVSFGDDPLRMLRAARFVSQLGFTVAPRVRDGDRGDGPAAGPHQRRTGGRRAGQAAARRRPGRRHRPAGADRDGRGGAARGRWHADGHRRTPPAQGRLPAFADGAAAGDRAGDDRTAPIWCCAGRRCCTTSASPPPGGTSPTAA